MGLSIHGEFSKAGISEWQHKEANCVRAWICPVAARSLGLNGLAMCVNLRDLKYAGFSQSTVQQPCGCLGGDGMPHQWQG